MTQENPYQSLADYLLYLEAAYHLRLCVKDYVGFIPINKELSKILTPYLGHTNPYCMHIKQDRERWYHCLSMMKKMAGKCIAEGGTFCGTCYAGIGEYVTPIFWRGKLLGALTAGFIEVQEDEALSRINRAMIHASEAEREEAHRLYREWITPTAVSSQVVLPALNMVASYLALTYHMTKESLSSGELAKSRVSSGSDEIFHKAVAFMHQEYPNQITAAILAEECHCSVSSINHLLKKRLGVGMSTYINKLRIERAKEYLLETEDTMLSIAVRVGFSDANYFARVFQQLMDISPSEFRRRYK